MVKNESDSDAALLRHALSGDEYAFVTLYDRLKRGIFRYAYYMTNSRASAEEVTQEVFMVLLREGARYREEQGEVGAFVFGIARNLVKRLGRRERVYQELPRDEDVERLSKRLVSEAEELPTRMIRGEVVEKVQTAIASLPDRYREVVVLCDLCELPYAEAAARVGCALGTVRSRLNRGHSLLAKKLNSLRTTVESEAAPGSEGCVI